MALLGKHTIARNFTGSNSLLYIFRFFTGKKRLLNGIKQ